eukprot:1161400-Pyramimonas_sp.AAC.1
MVQLAGFESVTGGVSFKACNLGAGRHLVDPFPRVGAKVNGSRLRIKLSLALEILESSNFVPRGNIMRVAPS